MPPSKEKQLKALREMLDGIYVDAAQAHAEGTIPCDLTIIFTALASLTVNYDNVDERIEILATDVREVKNNLDEVVTNIKICDATNQGKRMVWVGIISFISGGLGLMILKWIIENSIAGGVS